MHKAERLLDLAAFLLRAAEPISWREIQEQFPDDYGGSEEAAVRKFERDKAELLEIGIPVRWISHPRTSPSSTWRVRRPWRRASSRTRRTSRTRSTSSPSPRARRARPRPR